MKNFKDKIFKKVLCLLLMFSLGINVPVARESGFFEEKLAPKTTISQLMLETLLLVSNERVGQVIEDYLQSQPDLASIQSVDLILEEGVEGIRTFLLESTPKTLEEIQALSEEQHDLLFELWFTIQDVFRIPGLDLLDQELELLNRFILFDDFYHQTYLLPDEGEEKEASRIESFVSQYTYAGAVIVIMATFFSSLMLMFLAQPVPTYAHMGWMPPPPPSQMIPTLVRIAVTHPDSYLRKRAVDQLGFNAFYLPDVALPGLVYALRDQDQSIRMSALQTLIPLIDYKPDLIYPILKHLNNENSEVRLMAFETFEALKINPIKSLISELESSQTSSKTYLAVRLRVPVWIDILTASLEDQNEAVRIQAAKQLSESSELFPRLIELLRGQLQNKTNSVRIAAALTLGDVLNKSLFAIGQVTQEDQFPYVGIKQTDQLRLEVVLDLARALENSDFSVKKAVARALVRIGEKAIPVLVTVLNSREIVDDRFVGQALVQLLTQAEVGKESIPFLILSLKSSKPLVRTAAQEVLVYSIGSDSIPYLLDLIRDGNSQEKQRGAEVLGKMHPYSMPYLMALLQKDETRALAEKTLVQMGRKVVPQLIEEVESNQLGLRFEVVAILQQIRLYEKDILPQIERWFKWEDKEMQLSAALIVGFVRMRDNQDYYNHKATRVLLRQLFTDTGREQRQLLTRAYFKSADKYDLGSRILVFDRYQRGFAKASRVLNDFYPLLKSKDKETQLLAALILSGLKRGMGEYSFKSWANKERLDKVSQALPVLLSNLDHSDLEAQMLVFSALSKQGSIPLRTVPQLIEGLKSPSFYIRLFSLKMIKNLDLNIKKEAAPKIVPLLLNMLSQNNHQARVSYDVSYDDVVEALGSLGPLAEGAVPALIEILSIKEEETEKDKRKLYLYFAQNEVAKTLGKIGPSAKKAVPALVGALNVESEHTREAAAKALGKIGPAAHAALPALFERLGDDKKDVRLSASESLGKIGSLNKDQLTRLFNYFKNNYYYDSVLPGKGLVAIAKRNPEMLKPFIPQLKEILGQNDDQKHFMIFEIVAVMGPEAKDLSDEVSDFIVHTYEKDKTRKALAAVKALKKMGPEAKPSIWALARAFKLKFKDQIHCELAKHALEVFVNVKVSNKFNKERTEMLISLFRYAQLQETVKKVMKTIGPDDQEAIPVLIQALQEYSDMSRRDRETRMLILKTLAQTGPAALDLLVGLLESKDVRIKRIVLRALKESGPSAKRALPHIKTMIHTESGHVLVEALRAIGSIGIDKRTSLSKSKFIVALEKGRELFPGFINPYVEKIKREKSEDLSEAVWLEGILYFYNQSVSIYPENREFATQMLKIMSAEESVILMSALGHLDPEVRIAASESLNVMGLPILSIFPQVFEKMNEPIDEKVKLNLSKVIVRGLYQVSVKSVDESLFNQLLENAFKIANIETLLLIDDHIEKNVFTSDELKEPRVREFVSMLSKRNKAQIKVALEGGTVDSFEAFLFSLEKGRKGMWTQLLYQVSSFDITITQEKQRKAKQIFSQLFESGYFVPGNQSGSGIQIFPVDAEKGVWSVQILRVPENFEGVWRGSFSRVELFRTEPGIRFEEQIASFFNDSAWVRAHYYIQHGYLSGIKGEKALNKVVTLLNENKTERLLFLTLLDRDEPGRLRASDSPKMKRKWKILRKLGSSADFYVAHQIVQAAEDPVLGTVLDQQVERARKLFLKRKKESKDSFKKSRPLLFRFWWKRLFDDPRPDQAIKELGDLGDVAKPAFDDIFDRTKGFRHVREGGGPLGDYKAAVQALVKIVGSDIGLLIRYFNQELKDINNEREIILALDILKGLDRDLILKNLDELFPLLMKKSQEVTLSQENFDPVSLVLIDLLIQIGDPVIEKLRSHTVDFERVDAAIVLLALYKKKNQEENSAEMVEIIREVYENSNEGKMRTLKRLVQIKQADILLPEMLVLVHESSIDEYKNFNLRWSLKMGFESLGDKGISVLIAALKDKTKYRKVVVEFLTGFGQKANRAIPELIRVSVEKKPNENKEKLQRKVETALWRVGPAGKESFSELVKMATDVNPTIRKLALKELVRMNMGSKKVVSLLFLESQKKDVSREDKQLIKKHLIKKGYAVIEFLFDQEGSDNSLWSYSKKDLFKKPTFKKGISGALQSWIVSVIVEVARSEELLTSDRLYKGVVSFLTVQLDNPATQRKALEGLLQLAIEKDSFEAFNAVKEKWKKLPKRLRSQFGKEFEKAKDLSKGPKTSLRKLNFQNLIGNLPFERAM